MPCRNSNFADIVHPEGLLQGYKEVFPHGVGRRTEGPGTDQGRILGLIETFLEDFEAMDPRLRKSHLQTILKAAHVSRDTIELEFRV